MNMNDDNKFSDFNELVYHVYEKIEEKYNKKILCYGQATGFYDLDLITGGLHKSELTVIAGRHSMGKTSFAMNVMTNIILQDKIPVLYISYETSGFIFVKKLLSLLSQINYQRLSNSTMLAKDWEKAAYSMSKLIEIGDKKLLQLISGCDLNSFELFDEIRAFALNNPEGVVFVDYYQLIKLPDATDRITELSSMAAGFKRLAIELNIPIVVMSQVSKIAKERNDKRPCLEDIAECDALAQHADNVMFIYRSDYYHNNIEDDTCYKKRETEIIIAKQKNGPIGTIKLLFKPEYFKFDNPIKAE